MKIKMWADLTGNVERLEMEIFKLQYEQWNMEPESDEWYETQCHIESLQAELYEAEGQVL